MVKKIFSTLVLMLFLVSCSSDDAISNQVNTNQRTFGIFKVQWGDTIALMNGTIGSNTLTNFDQMMATFPNIRTIQMKEVPGSSDDDTNLKVALKVYQKGIKTHLLDNGMIASGGTDFFLAGVQRTLGNNVKIGVHSWSDGTNDATSFPVGHSNHQPYIDYYVNVGYELSLAKNFYYYTINAAPASGIHWMTASEINTYKFVR